MQEVGGELGPIVEPRVRRLERQLGNMKVYASSSGKISRDLMLEWVQDILTPAVSENLTPEDGRTGIYDYTNGTISSLHADDNSAMDVEHRDDVLLLMDSWTRQTNILVRDAISRARTEVLLIPPHTTADLQPLDTIFKKYKKFVKRILEKAAFQNAVQNFTSREGAIIMHSIVWDQFSTPKYQDMLRYAWRKTDQNFVNEELTIGPPPTMVQDIQFDFDRSIKCQFNCSNNAFIRCSYRGEHACLTHFARGNCSSSARPSAIQHGIDP